MVPFSNCTDYLAQGDIYAMPLIAPYADKEIRIFRGSNGEPGFKVLESDDIEGCVFEYSELIDFLQKQPRESTIFPFEDNSGYPNELAVVSADLLEFYVIVSQTCDISGVDSVPKPFASILPIVSIASILKKNKINVQNNSQEDERPTVPQYLERAIPGVDFSTLKNDPYEFPDAVYRAVEGWQPAEKKARVIRNQTKNFINKIRENNREYFYYLPCSREYAVPEGFVDFCRLYTLPTETLNDLKEFRVSSISSPYKEQFAQKFSLYLSRIATPTPIDPKKLK